MVKTVQFNYVNVVSISSTCSSVAQLYRAFTSQPRLHSVHGHYTVCNVLIRSIVNHLLFHCCSQVIYVINEPSTMRSGLLRGGRSGLLRGGGDRDCCWLQQ